MRNQCKQEGACWKLQKECDGEGMAMARNLEGKGVTEVEEGKQGGVSVVATTLARWHGVETDTQRKRKGMRLFFAGRQSRCGQ